MYQQERMDEIMKILEKNHYVTVEYLVNKIRYSPASIRRDLTLLEKQGLVTRSYGGVTYKDANVSPFRFRQHSMKSAKNAIAKKAATLVNNGDVVYVDGSSTSQYIGHYLTYKKGITVITCNMLLANYLSERGVTTFCTGGRVAECPGILSGSMMLDSISKFNIDIAFCSSVAFNFNGQITTIGEHSVNNYKTLRKYAKKLAFLCGSDKFEAEGSFVALTLDEIDYFVSDKALPESLMKKYNTTKYLFTK
jgi:DeoR/GlpR family transcriptional regulator of sugar metabolism